MSNLKTVTLRLALDANGVVVGVRAVTGETLKFGQQAQQSGQRADRGFRQAAGGAQSLEQRMGGVAKSILAIGGITLGAGLVSQISRQADAWTNLSGSIGLVTNSQAEANAVTAQVFDIAQRTRADLSATAKLYTQLARSGAELNISQAQTAQITETVNKSFAISHAPVESARAAIIQLNQGLAAGALRGDEFNSVAEQAPIIMDLLGASLGKTRGELREFAAQGGISAQIMIDALTQGAESVNAQFSQLQPTIAGASQALSNAATKFVGEASQSSGAAAGLADVILALSRNFETVANGALLLGAAAGAIFAGRTLGQVGAYSSKLIEGVAAQSAFNDMQKLAAAGALETATATTVEIEATLRAVDSVRAEIAAKQALLRADVAVAEAALAASSATTTGSFALKVQREATDQLTAAKLRQSAVTKELAVLGAQQGALQAKLGASSAAQIAAQGQLNTAIAQGGVVMQGARAIGARFLGLIGGWPTVLIAAGFGVKALYDRLAAEDAALNKPITDLRAYNDELEKAAEAARNLAAANGDAAAAANLSAYDAAAARASELKVQLEAALAAQKRFDDGGIRGRGVSTMQARVAELTARLAEADAELARNGDLLADNAIFIDGAHAATEKFGQSTAEFGKSLQDTIDKLALERAELAGGVRGRLIAQALLSTGAKSYDALSASVREQIESIANETAAIDGIKRARSAATTAAEAAKRQREEDIKLSQQFSAATAELSAQLAGPAAVAALKYTKGLGEAAVLFAAGKISADQLTGRIRALSGEFDKNTVAITKTAPKLVQILSALQDEARLIGLSDDERQIAIALREAENAAAEDGNALTDDEKEALKSQIAEQLKSNQAREAAIALIDKQTEASKALAEADAQFAGFLAQGIGQTFIDAFQGGGSIGGAIEDAFSNSLKGVGDSFNQRFASDLGESIKKGMKDGFKGDDAKEIVLNLSKVIGSAIGSAIGGGGAGASAGSSIGSQVGSTFGPIGSIIGGLAGGLLGGLFDKTPKLQVSGTRQRNTENSGQSQLGGIFVDSDKTGINQQQFIGQLVTLDNNIASVIRQFTAGTEALNRAEDAIAAFDVTLKGKGATAEAVVRLRFEAILATFDDTIQAFVRQGGTVEDQLARFGSILAVQSGLERANIGVGLTEFVPLIDEFGIAGEDAAATADRIIASTRLLDTGLGLSNVALDKTREEVVAFAAGVERAAGGLERAQTLWDAYFETFFSANERATQSLTTATSNATKEFGDIGLNLADFSGSDGIAKFRRLFSETLPTLSAEATAQWLEAARALGLLGEAQQAANVGGLQTAAQATQLADIMRGVNQALDEFDLSPLEIELKRSKEAINNAVEQARLLGASEDDLSRIRELGVRQGVERLRETFRQLAEAISGVRASIAADIQRIRSSQPGFNAVGFQTANIDSLRGDLANTTDPQQQISIIDQIRQALIARYEAEQQGIAAGQQAAAEAAQAGLASISAQREALDRLRDFADSFGLSAASPLTARERLSEAQRLFDQTLASARGGDANAINQLQQVANSLATENRAVNGVSAVGVAKFNEIQALLRGVAGQGVQQFADPFQSASIQGLQNIGGLQGDTIAELMRLDEQARAIEIAQQATLDGSIQSLEDLGEQDEANHIELIDTLSPVAAATAASAANSAAHLEEARAQTERFLQIDNKMQEQVELTGVLIETLVGLSGSQTAQVEALIANLGRAIERNSAAAVRA